MSVSSEFSLIQHLIRFCSSNDETELCIEAIERAVSQLHNSAPCAVYLLDRQYQQFSRYTNSDFFPKTLDMNIGALDESVFVQECQRKKTTVGLICIKKDSNFFVRQSAILAISDIVNLVYNRLFAANLFAHIHTPISYHQAEDTFFKELELLTSICAAMCAGALRELSKDGKSLTTLFAWNLGYESASIADWDIQSLDEVAELKKVTETWKPNALNSIPPNQLFFHRPEQSKIKSAVFLPVLVGTEIFGVLSFALHAPYEYTQLEIDGFFSIANAIGVAIHNFRQASVENEELGISVRNATVFTALEVAQAARHTAKGVIDTVNIQLAHLMYLAKRKGLGEVESAAESISENIFTITKALNDIKAASRPPKNELVSYSLSTIWEEASRQLLGKLNAHRINPRWDGPDVVIQCFPDQMRQVFLNLLINSIDSFTARGTTGKRNITIRPESHPNTKLLKLTYIDNAGGLDMQSLQRWKRDDVSDLSQLIFEKDVTTKGDEGSGWGLYICRRVIARHFGSINLLDYRRGMTFVIHLPKEWPEDR
jgi:signal transduction histidine kinase